MTHACNMKNKEEIRLALVNAVLRIAAPMTSRSAGSAIAS
jgi:hypothetical protein